jgi:arylsulfatase A-like enzyme
MSYRFKGLVGRNSVVLVSASGLALRSPSFLLSFLSSSVPLLCILSSQVHSSQAAPRPNILFILSDDHRPDCIAALGNRHIETPNLDRLVQRGMTFSRTYCMGSMEGAVCLPSRCMIQTGRSLFHLAPVNFRKGMEEFARFTRGKSEGQDWALLPRTLQAAGYETFHVGKGGNECTPSLEAFDQNLIYNDDTVELRVGSSQRHADAVIEFLRSRKGEKPFFIYLAPPVPHDPRVCPSTFRDQYDSARIPLPVSFLPVHPFDNGEMTVRDEELAPWPRTPEDTRRQLADYYACISNFDYQLGRVFDQLKQSGEWQRTIVVFAGDNGLSLGEHGLFGKQNLYEFGGMHVPLVFAGPGIKKGRSDAFVYLLDLFPTFCELAGATVPSCAEGKSLVALLQGQKTKLRDGIFTAYRNCQRSWRDDRWKLIRYPLVDKTQLFDLRADPHELHNLADQSALGRKVAELMTLLAQKQTEFGDTAPLTVPEPKPAAWAPPSRGR